MRSLSNNEDLAQIKERLHGVAPSDTARWGVMQASEMICHLRGAFRMAMGEIASEGAVMAVPSPVMKFLALRVPLSWPKSYRTLPALERGTPDMIPRSFEADLRNALKALDRFCTTTTQHRGDHPYMGSMSAADWMRWGYLHTDHHLRQFGR